MSKKPAIEIPHHVAVVMDGNGRWAKDRGLPRTAGHEAGEKALFDVVEGAIEFGVKGFAGIHLNIDMAARFKSCAEFRHRATNAFSDSANTTMFASKHCDDSISLTQLLGAQNYRFITVKAHGVTVVSEWRDLLQTQRP